VGWIKDTYDIAREVLGALAKPARAIRKIPIVDEFLGRLSRRFLNPIVVRQITNPDSPDLESAFELYETRIPESQRFEAADIARWLREDRENRNVANAPRDCFFGRQI
jgi:hypothetical protein